jgi:hypothetical protein
MTEHRSLNNALDLPSALQWTPSGRLLVFFLSATSIWCLLAEFYGLCSMRLFTLAVLIPSTAALIVMDCIDFFRGNGQLFRALMIGAVGGLLAAVAYDLFRIPFVVAHANGVGPAWARLPLFAVFPQFGAMILRAPSAGHEAPFTLSEHVLGWIYHFSNGITFGVMYMAMIGDARRRSWLWAVALAAGLELAMLFTPYTGFFGINFTARFVVVTLLAHLIFGVALGLYSRRRSMQWNPVAIVGA